MKSVSPRLLHSEPMRRCRLEKCRAACCLHGAWVKVEKAEEILASAHLIKHHVPPGQRSTEKWFDGRQEPDEHVKGRQVVHTTVVDDPDHYGGTACVFTRSDHKCALQVAGEAEGRHRWHFKPFYCILHPLDLDEKGCITLDTNDSLLDEPGSCLRPAGRRIPLLETFEEELRYLLGDAEYEELLNKLP